MSSNQTLQVILHEALCAYEQARLVHLRSQQAAYAEYARTVAGLTAIEKAERTGLAMTASEQMANLNIAVIRLEEAARTSLSQARLAQIACTPVTEDAPLANFRYSDAEVAQLFVQAQTSYVALREAILGLARAQVMLGQLSAAQQTIKPLLAENEGAFYQEALEVQRVSHLMAAKRALEAEQWEMVRITLEPWLEDHMSDEEAEMLVLESYYLEAQAALRQNNSELGFRALVALTRHLHDYKDARARLQEAFQGMLMFIYIPPGEFTYDVGNKRIHLPEYRISRSPISFLHFKMLMDTTGYSANPSGGGTAPVTNVSWDDATAFCAWAGLALPSEEQWFKAICASGTSRQLEEGSIEWEWCSNPHERGGHALRKFTPGSNAVGYPPRDWRHSFYRDWKVGFRVVAP